MSGDLRVPLAVLEETGPAIRHALGRAIASRLNQTWSPAVVLGTVKGLSIRDVYAKIFYTQETNLQFLLPLNRCMKPQIRVKELDLHSNSLDFAGSVCDAFQELLPEMH